VAKTIDQLLDEARARLRRLSPAETADALAAGALVVDIRPTEQRHRDGELPGARVVERNVLEGYMSSLAAATLQELGFRHATDLIGGFQAWKAAGLPVR